MKFILVLLCRDMQEMEWSTRFVLVTLVPFFKQKTAAVFFEDDEFFSIFDAFGKKVHDLKSQILCVTPGSLIICRGNNWKRLQKQLQSIWLQFNFSPRNSLSRTALIGC